MDISAGRDAELIDSIAASQRVVAAAEAATAADMLEFVELRRSAATLKLGGTKAGDLEAECAAHELSLALALPVGSIYLQLAHARRVRAELPAVWAAWLKGDLTSAKVTRIDEACDRLTVASSRALLDESVLSVARAKTPGQLQSWLTRFVARVEADRARERARKARRGRYVSVKPDYDAMSWVNAHLSSLDAAEIDTRLSAFARAMGAADDRTLDQRRSDAFRDLLLGRVANGYAPRDGDTGSRLPSTVIGVVVPIQSLIGDCDLPGETLDRSMSVPADDVRERAAEPGTLFWRLVTDRLGNLLDATELGRFASHKLGFALKARDGTSVFPTSNVPSMRCDVDHTIAHCDHPHCTDPRHGPTQAANLGLLDRRAHNLKTAGAISLRQPRPGVFQWTTQTGHHYTHTADALPVADWDEPDTLIGMQWTDRDRGDPCVDQDTWNECWDPDWEAA